VLLAGEDAHPPYRRPPLSKDYLRGESGRDELALQPTTWYVREQVRMETRARVLALDAEARTADVDGVGSVAFDRCVITTGAAPARPAAIPGAEDSRALTLRTIENADALRAAGGRLVVVGSGFIGCEAAASMAMRGTEVTLVTDEAVPHAGRLGREVGERISGWLSETGVTVLTGREVGAVEPPAVRLADGARVTGDAVLLALGVEARVELAEAAGLDTEDGRLICDESGRTSADGIWAAGDLARLFNPTAGRRLTVEHWGEALTQGEVAGRSAAGQQSAWDSVPGFWSTIGRRTIKYAAWGDGHDDVRLRGDDAAWSAWFVRDGACVGVLSHNRDGDYELGRELVARGERIP